jgi:hypothetical protein
VLTLRSFEGPGAALFTGTITTPFQPPGRTRFELMKLRFATVQGHPRVTWDAAATSRLPPGGIPSPTQDLASDWLCPLGHTPAIVHPTLHLAGSQAFATTYQGSPATGTFTYDLRVQLSDQRFNHPPRAIPGSRWPHRDACAAVGSAAPALVGAGYRAHRGESSRDCVLVGPRATVFVALAHEGRAVFAYGRRASLGGFDDIGYPRIGFPAYTITSAADGSSAVWALARGETIHVYTHPDRGQRRPALARLVRLARAVGRHLP